MKNSITTFYLHELRKDIAADHNKSTEKDYLNYKE